ncbi:MAG: cob(I)yrinic acid a,c-diamide adenosyltransferase [Candidatus Bathyarchaeia archaeon]
MSNPKLPLPLVGGVSLGYVYLYTGTGGGKTANALGLALRTVGHGKRVVIVQFCKWRQDTGEFLVRQRLGDLYEIYAFGRDVWLGTESRTVDFGGEKFQVEAVTDRDRELAEDALAFAAGVMQERQPALLVLDEVNLAVHWGLLPVGRVLELLSHVPKETTVVLTGRYAAKALLERADFVNIVQDVKMPEKFEPTKGIQY